MSRYKFSREIAALFKKHVPDPADIRTAMQQVLGEKIPAHFGKDLSTAVEFLVGEKPTTTVEELAEAFDSIPGNNSLVQALRALPPK